MSALPAKTVQSVFECESEHGHRQKPSGRLRVRGKFLFQGDEKVAAYNTIDTWKNKGKDVVYKGDRYYWSKDREFKKFLDVPPEHDVPFEFAMGVDEKVKKRLASNR